MTFPLLLTVTYTNIWYKVAGTYICGQALSLFTVLVFQHSHLLNGRYNGQVQSNYLNQPATLEAVTMDRTYSNPRPETRTVRFVLTS